MRKAFSLVELSIVLVILGLLVGGILAGQSLIRAAELRSIGRDLEMFVAATHTFRDKYFQLPGDFNQAVQFWGHDAADCSGHGGVARTPGTCNGNNDGRIAWTWESLLYWQHLANAGLITGTFTAKAPGGVLVPGQNVYPSKVAQGAYLTRYSSLPYGYGSSNLFLVGAYDSGTQYLDYGLLLPEAAWSIDNKIDDGLADSGRLFAYNGWDHATQRCVSSGDYNVKPSNYVLSGTAPDCLLYLRY